MNLNEWETKLNEGLQDPLGREVKGKVQGTDPLGGVVIDDRNSIGSTRSIIR